jgi:hypothetical protein
LQGFSACVGLVDHGSVATHPGVRSSLVFRQCMNPYRGIAGSQNADGTVAERVGDFAEVDADTAREVTADLLAAADELDALETGLVADVELHPGASATR